MGDRDSQMGVSDPGQSFSRDKARSQVPVLERATSDVGLERAWQVDRETLDVWVVDCDTTVWRFPFDAAGG